MSTTTEYPHLDLMNEHNINKTDLPEKTQKLISKFVAATDEETKEALDEKIHGDVEDYIEAKEKKAKEEAKKAAYAATKQKLAQKKIDLSNAPTAIEPSKEEKKVAKETTFTGRFFGRK